MTPLLSVENLNVTLGNREIIHDLNFEVREGDCLAIIGPNGAGKTILLKVLLQLVPYHGKIRWSRHARLGYVPQSVAADRHLPLSARDLLAAKARFLKLSPAELESIVSELGLHSDLLRSEIGALSGGQFQKVLIAFALLGRPNVLLFDEPTASLDELTEERVYDLLYSLQKERGMTILLVSHDLSVVYRNANMVLCLSKERPCIGPPKEVLTPATLEELYSGPSHYHVHHSPEVPLEPGVGALIKTTTKIMTKK
jgi:zinc transport system ATP-binding protein